MKNTFTIILLVLSISIYSQNGILKFNTKYYDAVDKWVAFPSTDNDSIYHYGFIYIDEMAGFTFETGNTFKISEDSTFIAKKPSETTRMIYRIEKNWKPLAIIPKDKLKQMGLPEVSKSLFAYKANSESASYLTKIGYFYNHVGASHNAIKPLNKAYKIDPHYSGLEFELSFAYNALQKFDKAIPILIKAIKQDPQNYLLYKELGFSYINSEKFDEAEKIYLKGIELADNNNLKSEMALNMAHTYFKLQNIKKFDEWAKLTRKYSEENSTYTQYINLFEKEWSAN